MPPDTKQSVNDRAEMGRRLASCVASFADLFAAAEQADLGRANARAVVLDFVRSCLGWRAFVDVEPRYLWRDCPGYDFEVKGSPVPFVVEISHLPFVAGPSLSGLQMAKAQGFARYLMTTGRTWQVLDVDREWAGQRLAEFDPPYKDAARMRLWLGQKREGEGLVGVFDLCSGEASEAAVDALCELARPSLFHHHQPRLVSNNLPPMIGADESDRPDLFYGGTLLSFATPGWKDYSWCPYCAAELRVIRRLDNLEVRAYFGGRSDTNERFVLFCSRCGWWRFGEEMLHPGTGYRDRVCICAALARFDPEFLASVETPLGELNAVLARRFDRICGVSPTGLEHLVRDIVRSHFACEVRHCGGPGDNGVDLLAIMGDHPVAIQVKRRSKQDQAESASTVRDFIGALVLSGCERGLIVTTAPRFSRAAVAAAANPKLQRHSIRIDLASLDAMRSMFQLEWNKARLPGPWDYFFRYGVAGGRVFESISTELP